MSCPSSSAVNLTAAAVPYWECPRLGCCCDAPGQFQSTPWLHPLQKSLHPIFIYCRLTTCYHEQHWSTCHGAVWPGWSCIQFPLQERSQQGWLEPSANHLGVDISDAEAEKSTCPQETADQKAVCEKGSFLKQRNLSARGKELKSVAMHEYKHVSYCFHQAEARGEVVQWDHLSRATSCSPLPPFSAVSSAAGPGMFRHMSWPCPFSFYSWIHCPSNTFISLLILSDTPSSIPSI